MLIKICGITTIEAAQVASEAGADFLGLMFYPPSPRYLSPSATDDLVAAIKRLARRPKLVGLFVNLPLPEIAAAVARYDLDYIQLHGEENPPLCQEAARLRPVIRALRLPLQIEPAAALRLAAPFGQLDGLTLLLDTHKSGMYGGTGQVGEWAAARTIAQAFPALLAGGLTAENVGAAIAQVQPWGVDVSSGVEKQAAPGQKDMAKIKQFIAACKTGSFSTIED